MARQRITRQEGSASATAERDVLDPTTDALVRASGPAPGQLAAGLQHADPWTRARAVQRLQAGLGNAAVGSMLGPRHARTEHLHIERRAGDDKSHTTVQREEGDLPEDGAVALETTTAGGATEDIGVPAQTDYAVSASSLADVLAAISGRKEAGYVGWTQAMTSSAPNGPTVETVSVEVHITLEMPSWAPPSSMLPKARAEWNRWYAALLAHEQGHIQIVHDVYDGLAKRLIGKTPAAATAAFNAAKASLTTKSAAYDTKTGHGLKTGTVLDVGIETLELDEEKKKKAAAAKPQGHEATVPDVPGDE